MLRKVMLFFVCLIICCLPVLASVFILPEALTGWYSLLIKPPFIAPDWVFGPVWTLLYILLATVLFIVMRAKIPAKEKRYPLMLFFAQLLLSMIWPPVFFAMQYFFLGFCIIALMVALNADFIRSVNKKVPWAAYLMYPYIMWLCYAGYLNGGVYILN